MINWTFEMTMYLIFAVSLFSAIVIIFYLAGKLSLAELERELANYELKKLRAYREAKETYDSQG
jgi:uncharacterized membrane protein YccC